MIIIIIFLVLKMNKSFQKVVNFYKPTVNLAHKNVVMRLYRQSLRTIISWCESREVFNFEASKLRIRFNENTDIPLGRFVRSCVKTQ